MLQKSINLKVNFDNGMCFELEVNVVLRAEIFFMRNIIIFTALFFSEFDLLYAQSNLPSIVDLLHLLPKIIP